MLFLFQLLIFFFVKLRLPFNICVVNITYHFVDAASIKEILLPLYQQEVSRVKVSPIHEKSLELKDLFVPLHIQKNHITKPGNVGNSTDKETVTSLRDIFFSEETFTKRIYITGESGIGKTMLCLKLLESWVRGNQMHDIPVDSLAKCLTMFELVFYVPLRESRDDTMSLMDMICKNISKGDPKKENNIKHVLRSPYIRCLVIVDGLDEWKMTSTSLDDLQTYGLVNCVLLYTMRPWVLSTIQMKLNDNDAVFDILGFDPYNVDEFVGKTLTQVCGVEPNSEQFYQYSRRLKVSEFNFNSIINPMMLFFFTLRLCEKNEPFKESAVLPSYRGNPSITHISLSMMEVMIQRAESKDNVVKSYIKEKKKLQHHKFEKISSDFPYIITCDDLLMAFCRLAYNDLIDDPSCLIFKKIQLDKEIGEEKFELVHKIGLISERKALSTSFQQYIRIGFIHKSIQDLMAAIYIIHDKADILKCFIAECNSILKVMLFSGVITNICGMDVKAGDTILKHIFKITKSDIHLCAYRQMSHDHDKQDVRDKILDLKRTILNPLKDPSQKEWLADSNLPFLNTEYPFHTVPFLYKMLSVWHKEIGYNNNDFCSPQTFYVRDIYLDRNSCREDINMARKMMLHSGRNVLSVTLDGEMLVDEKTVEALSNCRNVVYTQIPYIPDSKSRTLFLEALNRITSLRQVSYFGSIKFNKDSLTDNTILSGLLCQKHLKKITCTNVILDENLPMNTFGTSKIEYVFFENFLMPLSRWKQFAKRFNSGRCKSYISLMETNIDLSSVSFITSCANCTVLCNDIDNKGKCRVFVFHSQPSNKLKYIELSNTSLLNSEIFISKTMTSLNSVTLCSVRMQASGWRSLIIGLYSVWNMVYVKLKDTNIDADSVSHIVESSAFTVISNSQRSEDGGYKCLCFYTKPASKLEIIRICDSAFGDSGITISDNMTNLSEINLQSVQMSRKGWCIFIDSIRSEENIRLCVTLNKTNVDKESIDQITSCPNIAKVSESGEGNNGKMVFHVRYLYTPKCVPILCAVRDRKEARTFAAPVIMLVFSIVAYVGIAVLGSVLDHGYANVVGSASAAFLLCIVLGPVVGAVVCVGCAVLCGDGIGDGIGDRVSVGLFYSSFVGFLVGVIVGIVFFTVIAVVGRPVFPVSVFHGVFMTCIPAAWGFMLYLVKGLVGSRCCKKQSTTA